MIGVNEGKVIAGIASLLDAAAHRSAAESSGSTNSPFYLLEGHSGNFLDFF